MRARTRARDLFQFYLHILFLDSSERHSGRCACKTTSQNIPLKTSDIFSKTSDILAKTSDIFSKASDISAKTSDISAETSDIKSTIYGWLDLSPSFVL